MASKTEDQGTKTTPRLNDFLHIVQKFNSLEDVPITGESQAEILQNAQNLAQIESIAGFLPIKSQSKAPMCSFKGKEYKPLKKTLSYGPAAIAVISENIAGLDYDYPRSLDYAASRGIDFTAKGFHVRKTSDNWGWDKTGLDLEPTFHRFKTLFVLTDEQAAEIGPCNSAKQDYQGSGIDVFPKAKPYIIVSGKHEKEGLYYSPHGLDVVDLAPPSPEVLELLIEANQSRSTPKRTSSSPSCNGEWIAALPCPICNRDKDKDCRTNRAGDVILCHRGKTFSPPTLDVGEIIAGTKWAYCGSGESAHGTHSTFKIHRPSTLQALYARQVERCK
tara:strand:+ start:599 stop:1594 length:996 start_codon:yes stop_codon:yes gene_type:complete